MLDKAWYTGQELVEDYNYDYRELYEAHHEGYITAYRGDIACTRREATPPDKKVINRSEDEILSEEERLNEEEAGFNFLSIDDVPKARFHCDELNRWAGRTAQGGEGDAGAENEADDQGAVDAQGEAGEPTISAMPSVKNRVSSDGTGNTQVKRTCKENKDAFDHVQEILRQTPAASNGLYAELVNQIRAAGGSYGVAGCLIFPDSQSIDAARQAAKYRKGTGTG
jgi:hypothetical protein